MNVSTVLDPFDHEGIRPSVNTWLTRAGIGIPRRFASPGWIPDHQRRVCDALRVLGPVLAVYAPGTRVNLGVWRRHYETAPGCVGCMVTVGRKRVGILALGPGESGISFLPVLSK